MINEQDKKSLIALKDHTLSSVYNDFKYRSPVYLSNRNINYKENINIYPVEYFHYGDRYYSNIYSIDHPEQTIGIIKVDSMPYSTLIKKFEKKSFVCNMHDIIYQRYCEPFIIFIDGKFVNWNYISLLFDSGDSYIILHGDEYNCYNLKYAKIDIIILPFKIDYIGEESNIFFDHMYEVYKSYIQKSLVYKNDKYYITVPGMDTTHEYQSMIYNVGAWLYSQLKYNYLGLLSDYKINKLKNMDIINNIYDNAGNIINTYHMKFNAFDKDSYNKTIYDNLCISSVEQYRSTALFRFNSNGLLDNNGDNILSIYNSNIEFYITELNSEIYKNQEQHKLFRENFMIFKNGKFDPENKIDIYYNIAKISDYQDKILYTIYNNKLRDIICYPNTHLNELSFNYIKDNLNLEYINDLFNPFDFQDDASKNYNDNMDSLMNSIINYDVTLLDSMHKSNIESKLYSGKYINSCIEIYNSINGFRINRNKYKNNDTCIIIFENGELINEYNNLIIYPNFFFLPIDREFNDEDQIEILYFNKINNNEIKFKMNNSIISDLTDDPLIYQDIECSIFSKFINISDLKIFAQYPEKMLLYKSIIPESEKIAFNVSKYENDKIYINSTISYDTELTAVSSRKFIYQRLTPKQKTYRIEIDSRFKYCDNQKQYILFINGRRMSDDSFLITIPKYSRPFWGIYLYTAKIISPEDRIDLFYVPEELIDINFDNNSYLDESGYIQTNKNLIDVPYNPTLYILFINGKKIAKDDIVAIDSSTFRIKKDQYSINNLMINPIYNNTYSNIKNYMKSNNLNSYDRLMKSLPLSEIDNLFNTHIYLSDIDEELYKVNRNVARIAILNEIIRDFWVSSGFNYNEAPFAYDYITDEYIKTSNQNEEDNFYILSSLNATQFENIHKDDLSFIYATPESKYYEIGSSINSINISWDYSYGFYNALKLYKQYIEYKNESDNEYTRVDIDIDERSWIYNTAINSNIKFIINGISAKSHVKNIIDIKFANGIYYGLIDENESKNITSNEELINIFNKLETNNFTKVLQDSPEINLKNYIIGNNNYFVYTCPKRLVFDQNELLIEFLMPEVYNADIIQNCRDDKTTPIYTDGTYNIYETNNLFKIVPKMNMIYLGEYNYTNSSGYTESYCIWRSNGYFTRLFNNYKFKIQIRYKDGSSI